MYIYVASSWKNVLHPAIVHALRRCGHEVYDFRNPEPGKEAFSWESIDPKWKDWDAKAYRKALQHSLAKKGYETNLGELQSCDACVLVLPAGCSASWELGYAMGVDKLVYVVDFLGGSPELMFREIKIITSMNELFDAFGEPTEGSPIPLSELMKSLNGGVAGRSDPRNNN